MEEYHSITNLRPGQNETELRYRERERVLAKLAGRVRVEQPYTLVLTQKKVKAVYENSYGITVKEYPQSDQLETFIELREVETRRVSHLRVVGYEETPSLKLVKPALRELTDRIKRRLFFWR